MFPLKCLRRPVVATWILLLGSVAPTCYVAAFAWRVHWAGYPRQVELELGGRLGTQVSIGSVRHGTPFETEYDQLVLRREEGQAAGGVLAELMRFDRVKVVREPGRLTLRAEGLALNSGDLASGVDTLLGLAGRVAREGERLDMSCPEVKLAVRGSEGDIRRSVGAVVAVGRVENGLSLSTSFEAVAGDPSCRCELTLRRQAARGDSLTTCHLKTVEGSVPIDLLESLIETRGWTGERARFAGSLTFTKAGAAPWELTVRGRIERLDLDALVRTRFPGVQIRGEADLEIDEARWGTLMYGQGRGWNIARGCLRVRAGTLDSVLLDGLAKEMGLQVSRPGVRNPTELDFEALALNFDLEGSGELRITGALGEEYPRNAVLVGRHDSGLLVRAPDDPATVRGLWKALFPLGADVLVPATAESGVMRHLPLPLTRHAGQAAVAN